MSKKTDEEIVQLVREQDKEIYAQIIKRYQNKLIRYVKTLVSDDQQAADVVQQTFIKAYINLQGFDIKRRFSSWIYRIAHNESMNILRKQKKEISLNDEIDYQTDDYLQDDVVKEELKRNANKCLAQVPVIYREPLSLFFLDGASYEEISDILRIPVGTVGTRINRGKAIMKKICEKKIKV